MGVRFVQRMRVRFVQRMGVRMGVQTVDMEAVYEATASGQQYKVSIRQMEVRSHSHLAAQSLKSSRSRIKNAKASDCGGGRWVVMDRLAGGRVGVVLVLNRMGSA